MGLSDSTRSPDKITAASRITTARYFILFFPRRVYVRVAGAALFKNDDNFPKCFFAAIKDENSRRKASLSQ